MADQKIKLQVGADTSELMAALDQVVKKTQQVQNQLKSLTTSPKAQQPILSPEEKRYQQVLGDVKKDEEKSRVNRAAQDIAKRQLQDIRREIEANGRAESKNEKDREQAQRNINRLKEEEKRITETLNRLTGKTGGGAMPPGGRPPSGGGGIGAGGISSAGGLASALGIPAMAIGAVATAGFALKIGESIRRSFAEAQVEARAIQTQAYNTKGQAGQLLESAIMGRGLEDTMFNEQRAKGQATAENKINQRYSMSGPVNDALSYFGAGERVRNTFGAIQHFNLPQAYRAAIGSPEYQANITGEKAQEAATQTEVEKNAPENKATSAVKERFLQDFQKNLGFQRQTGMTEEQFRSFNINAANAGFMPEQAQAASSAIMSAGGGTRNAKANAGFALQMGKQFDLTNASQALGAIGGQLGSAQMSKDALIAVQAEGTRLGLNRSDLREENRRFVELASTAIGQSSVTSKEGYADLLQTFGKFMTGANTTQSIAAGRSAYEAYQALSSAQAGPGAVLRQANMRRDAVLGQLSQGDRNVLSLMTQEEVNSGSERVKAIAARSGLSPQQLVEANKSNIAESTFLLPGTREALAEFRKADKAMNGPLNPKDLEKRQVEFETASGKLMIEETKENATAGRDEKFLRQWNQQYRVNGMIGQPEANVARPGDIATAKQAQLEKLSDDLFNNLQGNLGLTAKAVEQLAASLAKVRAEALGTNKNSMPSSRATTPSAVHTGGTE